MDDPPPSDPTLFPLACMLKKKGCEVRKIYSGEDKVRGVNFVFTLYGPQGFLLALHLVTIPKGSQDHMGC